MRITLAILIAVAVLMARQAQAWDEDFETTAPGAVPAGWEVGAAARGDGWTAVSQADSAAVGSHCLQLVQRGSKARSWRGIGVGAVFRSFDATPFRGQTVRLSARLRHRKDEHTNGWAQIRLQARGGGIILANQNGGDRIVSEPVWARRVIALQVPVEADTLEVGFNVAGSGTGWIDDIRMEITPLDWARWNAPPAPLSDRGLENLVALGRLYGYVRFFHPSDEAFATQWGDFLLAAVERVEPAANAAELRQRLHEVFAPVAPTLELAASPFDAGERVRSNESKSEYVFWKHEGYGVEQVRTFYQSRRIVSQGLHSLLDADVRDGPKPGAVTVAEIAKDVWCRLPLVLSTKNGRTQPRAGGSPPRLDVPEEWGPQDADRRTRLAGVLVAWNVFQHFYPYFDVVQVDWPAALRAALTSAAQDADRDAYLRTLQRMVALTRDGHGRVSHSFDDHPFVLPLDWDWAEDRLVVTRGVEGGGADAPRRGDVVEALDGRSIADRVAAARPLIAAASEGWMHWRLRDQLLRYPSSQAVQIGLLDVAGKRRTVRVVPAPMSSWTRSREVRPENGAELAPGIVYFDLHGADETDLEMVLPKLSTARGVVLDLRGYPGGAGIRILEHLARERMTSAFWNVPHRFLPDQRGVAFVTGGRWKMRVRQPRIPASGGKVVFLTDGSAISYAESCMGIVEAYGLGTIVGSPTAGTNGDVAGIRLPGGFRISFTGLQVIKHDGTPHHGVGIRPTVPVERTVRGIAAGRDELLDEAVLRARGS